MDLGFLLFLTPGTKPPKRAAAAPCSSSSPLGSVLVSSRCVWAEGAKLQPSFEAYGTINHHIFYTYPASPLGELGNTLVLQNLK